LVTSEAPPDEDEFEAEEPSEDWLGDDLDALEDDLGDSDDFDDLEDEEEETEEDEEAEEEEEALDELEAEELEMLTEDEAAEALPVDEVEELRQIRREAMALETGAESVGSDEFVCASCFLVKRTTQLADKRRSLCRDCV
jgi:hypothetical protein